MSFIGICFTIFTNFNDKSFGVIKKNAKMEDEFEKRLFTKN